MSLKLNKRAVEHARSLIEKGEFVADDQDRWSEHQPSTDEENDYIEARGIEAFGRWHLAIESEEDVENKGRYKFPFGDFEKVHRGALIAVKQRAGQYDYDEIQRAGNELFEMIEGRGSEGA